MLSQVSKSPKGASADEPHLAAKLLGEEKNVGCTSFREERAFFEGEKSPAGGGKRTRCVWRQDDFGGGVYVRVRRMKTEALKGQIWQAPYLVAYWFWRALQGGIL